MVFLIQEDLNRVGIESQVRYQRFHSELQEYLEEDGRGRLCSDQFSYFAYRPRCVKTLHQQELSQCRLMNFDLVDINESCLISISVNVLILDADLPAFWILALEIDVVLRLYAQVVDSTQRMEAGL